MILVTGNLHKLAEFKRLIPIGDWETLREWELREQGIEGEEIIESADSFIGNAILKAQAGFSRTRCISVADDSGLCVDALDGAPGVYSARYASGSDVDRYQALLQALSALPEGTSRAAAFHCALAVCGLNGTQRAALADVSDHWDDPLTTSQVVDDCLVVTGRCVGFIREQPYGEQGFGYDPIFNLTDGRSFASLSGETKDLYSHRGVAIRALRRVLEKKNIIFI